MGRLSEKTLLQCLVLFLLVFALFARTSEFGYVNYDDNKYVYENQYVFDGFSLTNLKWAFTIHGPSMWIPLTWISHQLMFTFFGQDPGSHHLLNVLLHALNVVLVFLLLLRFGVLRVGAFAAAFVFAVHPIHVESVAWITERKDVLSLFFVLLALHAYLPGIDGKRNFMRQGIVTGLFALAVMAKPLAITLPCLLLVVDFVLPSLRGSGRGGVALILEKAPMFVFAAFASWMTILCQQSVDAIASVEDYPIHIRLANAVVNYCLYLRRMVLPVDLAVFYPYQNSISLAATVGCLLILAAISFTCWRLRRSNPLMLLGWLWYLGTMVPMIGLIQAGSAQVADRYAYFPFLGVYLGLAALSQQLVVQLNAIATARLVRLAAVSIAAVLVILNWQQVTHWQSSERLFRRALEVTDDNYLAHNNLALALRQQGRDEEAREHLKTALEIRPYYREALNNLATLEASKGNVQVGQQLLETLLSLYPDDVVALHNLAKIHLDRTDFGRAEELFQLALSKDPSYSPSQYDLAWLYLAQSRFGEAISLLEPLLVAHPGHLNAWINLGFAQQNLGRFAHARSSYTQAVKLDPNNRVAVESLARLDDGAF